MTKHITSVQGGEIIHNSPFSRQYTKEEVEEHAKKVYAIRAEREAKEKADAEKAAKEARKNRNLWQKFLDL